MKKTKTNLLIIVAAVFIAALNTVLSLDTVPAVNVSMLNHIPDPAEPGKYVDLRFKAYNDGTADAENVIVELIPVYPFFLDANEAPQKSLGIIKGYGQSRNVEIIKYKVRIDKNAVEGMNTIKLRYRVGNSQWIESEYEVEIQTIDATIAIESVTTVPQKIEPGKPVKITFKIKNMADSALEDVSLKFDLGLSTVALPATTSALSLYDVIPFAPLNSATEKKIRNINAGGEAEISFDFITYSDAESRIYKIPVQLRYFDSQNVEYIKNDIIGLVVGIKPELIITVDDTELYVGKSTGVVGIKLVNKGYSDIKFMNVMLGKSDRYEILSPDKVYLGNIDSDDYETAEFNLYMPVDPKDKSEKKIILPIKIEYRDSNGELYTNSMDLELKILSSGKLGIPAQSNIGLIIIIAIIVIIGFIMIRKAMRAKKK